MEIIVSKKEVSEISTPALVLSWFEKEKPLGMTANVDKILKGLLQKIVHEEKFEAKLGQTLIIRTKETIKAHRIILIGLGKRTDLDIENIRIATATAVNLLKQLKIKTFSSALLGLNKDNFDPKSIAQAMAEGALLANYSFTTYKTKPTVSDLKSLEMITKTAREANSASKGAELGFYMAKAAIYARDLVNMPGQDMCPEHLVAAAKKITQHSKTIKIKVYDQTQLKKMGAGCILGVAKGSIHPSFLVHMIYKPTTKTKKKVALVGKAVTFDSGGLSLKPAKYMENMKVDMGGSAAVLGAFSVIDQIAPKTEVHGIFAPCENMPSGSAMRPGDVVQAMNKKTVEVLNTDAEGRLALADSLTYALKQKPDYIIDLATLTGACVVALGEEISGLIGNNDLLIEKIQKAAHEAGEKFWPLPLEKNYKKLLKSSVADLCNIGGNYGGAITAGLFLSEFVDKTPWVHLDIAGPAYAERTINAYTKKGATGHATRTLLKFLKNI